MYCIHIPYIPRYLPTYLPMSVKSVPHRLGRDGRLFRVDFGFAFGRTPEIDAPGLFVPNAVFLALGEARWQQVGHGV